MHVGRSCQRHTAVGIRLHVGCDQAKRCERYRRVRFSVHERFLKKNAQVGIGFDRCGRVEERRAQPRVFLSRLRFDAAGNVDCVGTDETDRGADGFGGDAAAAPSVLLDDFEIGRNVIQRIGHRLFYLNAHHLREFRRIDRRQTKALR